MESEFMTVEEVAKYLKVSARTIKKLAKAGHLKQFGIGKNLRRYRKLDVDEMVEKLSKREVS